MRRQLAHQALWRIAERRAQWPRQRAPARRIERRRIVVILPLGPRPDRTDSAPRHLTRRAANVGA
jgi:hypothetical protein